MSILVIRTSKRFAVCRPAKVGTGAKPLKGLLIELSQEGCRISNIAAGFETGQLTTIRIDGFPPMDGTVRWARDGSVGLRFTTPLHKPALDSLIAACRHVATAAATPQRAYA